MTGPIYPGRSLAGRSLAGRSLAGRSLAGRVLAGRVLAGLMIGICLCATPAASGDLQVTVTGIPDDRGTLACSLHDRALGFPAAAPVTMVRGVPRGGRAQCRFNDLAPGRYAVAVLHDANDNGRLDTNLLGLPSEAWGVSAAEGVRRNPLRVPVFEDAAFDFGPGPGLLRIRLDR